MLPFVLGAIGNFITDCELVLMVFNRVTSYPFVLGATGNFITDCELLFLVFNHVKNCHFVLGIIGSSQNILSCRMAYHLLVFNLYLFENVHYL